MLTLWIALFAVSLVIRRLCLVRMNKTATVSRNVGRPRRKVYEQDRPYAECFDDNDLMYDLEDDL